MLVLQGGGALSVYQVGVYQTLHEVSLEPEWVIGTSIGAINAAIIAGNSPADRMARLNDFWGRIEHAAPSSTPPDWWGVAASAAQAAVFTRGVPGFFAPNPAALFGNHAPLGVEQASYYSTAPLRETLAELVDFSALGARGTRLTVGAVNACSGEMRYFDNRDEALGVDHIVASGALPPAFGAVRIGGEPYRDGGLYSNTPIEAVLDDSPRRNALVFAVSVWHQTAPEPASLGEVMARIKDVQFASRAGSHIARQKQIHRLRHVIRELAAQLPAARRAEQRVEELAAWGCQTADLPMRMIHRSATPAPDAMAWRACDSGRAGMEALLPA